MESFDHLMQMKEEDMSVEMLTEGYGESPLNTPVHHLAHNNYPFTKVDFLSIALRDDGKTVAHVQALNGRVFTDKEVLKIVDLKGVTVAHYMAYKGHVFEDNEVLHYKDEVRHVSVALIMASMGHRFDNEDILKFKGDVGTEVAMMMIGRGHIFTDKRILTMANQINHTVGEFQAEAIAKQTKH